MKKELIFRLVLVIAITLLVYQFGIKPVLSNEFYYKGASNNSWAKSKLAGQQDVYDVIVVGEEPDGIAAAVSAARVGAKTLLVSGTQDLGGAVSKSLFVDMEPSVGPGGELLSKGIFGELFDKLGENFKVDKYISNVNSLVKAQKGLDVVYGAENISPLLDDNTIYGISIASKDGKRNYMGKRFIDSTADGKLLEACNVPYFKGSADINMEKRFMPALLNFELNNVDWSLIKNTISVDKNEVFTALAQYKPSHMNVRINNFNIIDQGGNKVVVQGIEVLNLDASDQKAVAEAYKNVSDEVKDFAAFLANRLSIFKNSKLDKVAERFYIRENRHFLGEYRLSVNEVLENKDFVNKIAVGSYRVDIGKLADSSGAYIAGKPAAFGIPLGCTVPLRVDNLFMTGSKISCASIAASSISTLNVGITSGEAVGVAAVYSIIRNITPRELAQKKDAPETEELQRLLKRQGMNLSKISFKNNNTENWCYPAVRQLNSLGLIAGGLKNDYGFDSEASQEDMAMLLLNGIFRLAPDKYSLELDAKLRPYFTKERLTREKAGEILAALFGLNIDKAGAYDRVCQLGYINGEMQLRLTKPVDKKILTMDDVFYLSAHNIRLFTGKKIPD